MKLDPSAVVVVSKNQMASEIGGEVVILGVTAGRYFGLDQVGVRIWQLIQSPMSISTIRERLLAEYDVEPARCEADLLRILEQMHASGLIDVRADAV
ncbi:MAG TPA: PqqD family peptide modification chaperone [Thermoanaerobaculia bacterium]|jgi:hypothetical protein